MTSRAKATNTEAPRRPIQVHPYKAMSKTIGSQSRRILPSPYALIKRSHTTPGRNDDNECMRAKLAQLRVQLQSNRPIVKPIDNHEWYCDYCSLSRVRGSSVTSTTFGRHFLPQISSGWIRRALLYEERL
jgi:hypothetical protein